MYRLRRDMIRSLFRYGSYYNEYFLFGYEGKDNRYVVPLSLSLGASFMILIDTLSRSISIIELPLSILTAIIGAPAFISLLNKTRSNLQ